MIGGTPPNPNINFQLSSEFHLAQAMHMRYEINYPPVMNNTLHDTTIPRI